MTPDRTLTGLIADDNRDAANSLALYLGLKGYAVRVVSDGEPATFTSPAEYLAPHHLPNWYPLLADLTPVTRTFPADAVVAGEPRALGWGPTS